ncbi:MAG: GNAT family N-acetyltransferase [Gammaproteobacteria bacterium]|nr:GNAT family N-acetyltransferase [Gammaproteobacteria bacterium]
MLTSTYEQHQAGIQAVRRKVFIEEQGIDPALEWDKHDHEAVFAVALNPQDEVIGTARLLPQGKIGRMAVLIGYRRQGIASALLQHLLDVAKQQGHHCISLSAQQSVIDFYLKHGFAPVGQPHVEAGIPHQNMQYEMAASGN